MMQKFSICIAIVLAIGATQANAASVLNSFDSGWYDQAGSHNPVNDNTITGDCCSDGEHRGFWAFDLTGLTQVSDVSITFRSNGFLYTDTGSETISLFDYTGSINTLLNGGGGIAAFNDLGSGSLLGQYTITAANGTLMPEFTVSLSPTFVTQFNSALASGDKRISLGAKLQTILLGGQEDAFWAASSGNNAARLNITASAVPEPSTWAMMIGGFGAIGGAMRNRRRKVSVSFG